MEAFVRPTSIPCGTSLASPADSLPLCPTRPPTSVPRRRARRTSISLSAERSTTPRKSQGFILWGPPGSGKSTLCETLSHTHGLVHISTGSLLRAHVLYETERGIKSRPFVQSTRPVPDEIVIPMVLERLQQVDCADRGYLLDGFPRNINQHNALEDAGFHYTTTFMLHAPRDTLERRIRYRRLDPETDILYNLKLRPTDSQEVLERLVVLDKDRGANVPELFASYGRSTADIFELFASRARRIDADRPFDDVHADISMYLEQNGFRKLHDCERRTPANPLVAMPPEKVGGASDDERERANPDAIRPARLASDAAKMRARGIDAVPEDSATVAKAPITLIRCDGYMCERESVDQTNIAFRGAATEQVMLVWNKRPATVLLLVKKDPALLVNVLEAARYMIDVEKLNVIVEPQVQTRALANGLFLDTFVSSQNLYEKVDFVVCLGGDGLILHASTVFKAACPPVVSFNLGSLGFLTPFQFEDFKAEIRGVLQGNINLSLRMRLKCGIVRKGEVREEFEVLNEVVIDRGASPYLCNLDCFCDGKYITTVQADGIIMSTPTGSTAYSMSAGGSMVHPSVPAILFTPICPHSLSFRPIVFPDSAKLQIEISEDARSHAWASFDGKSRQQLKRGDGLLVEMDMFPVPTVNKTDHTGDWFQSLDRAFNFNNRAAQKPLSEVRRSRPRSRGNGVEGSRRRDSPKYVDSSVTSSDSDEELIHDEGAEKEVRSS